MDYEKKYKEAPLELARVAAFNGHQSLMEGIFPELAESKDEKTRKRIIALVNAHGQGMYKDDMLAWLENIPYTIDHEKREGFHLGYKAGLEKQGEKPKPSIRERYKRIANSEWFKKTHEGMSVSDDEKVDNVNKIEPKFKVGDFIVSDYCMGKVIALTDDAYLLDTEQGIPFSCEHNAHLWTIQDAKPGDVLTTDNCPCIFKSINEENAMVVYCGINGFGDFATKSESESNRWDDNPENYYPATKEQRDLLFTKMKESGYEWNSENKELKKISQRMISAEAKEALYNKPAWSEEDEEHIHSLLDRLEGMCKKDATFTATRFAVNQDIDWLKSLKDKYTWKPSIAQLNALSIVSKGNAPDDIEAIVSLYNDLKKLTE